ncbi:MAG: archaemetzincin family Zn-dependent metalloprotease [Desulfobacterota bacterium]|nr:archaemetzincin family Zn-dependent metalloprotease [Thermodesulfobacteriota bacterium]
MRRILLVRIGGVAQEVLDNLKPGLEARFYRKIDSGKGLPEPFYAYDKKRKQYLSTSILKELENLEECSTYERVLGVVDRDLFVPELNFVFGLAGRKGALFSLTRLRQEFYGLPGDQHLFERRALTEAVHELGHTYGLGHCPHPKCVMAFSNSLPDTDRKGPNFCHPCRSRLLQILPNER